MSEPSKELIGKACALYGASNFQSLISRFQADGTQIIKRRWVNWDPDDNSVFNRTYRIIAEVDPVHIKTDCEDSYRGAVLWYWNYVSAMWALMVPRDNTLAKIYTGKMLDLETYESGRLTQMFHILAHKGPGEAEAFVLESLEFGHNREMALLLIEDLRRNTKTPHDPDDEDLHEL